MLKETTIEGYRLVKSVPTKDYRSDYEVSDGLINSISQATYEPYSFHTYPALSAIQVALRLAKGDAVMVVSPFKDTCYWTLEQVWIDKEAA